MRKRRVFENGMIATVATAWWTLTFPALAIIVAVIALNLLGDGLRSALDPRRSGQ